MALLNPFRRNRPVLDWERLHNKQKKVPIIYRTAVPGGWLLSNEDNGGLTFVPDPKHEWDGASYPVFE